MSRRKNKYRKMIDEPNMSDRSLLLSVEDLINIAFGAVENNVVNFKIVQTVLHVLARQMRFLEQDVEIKFDEIGIENIATEAYADGDEQSSADGKEGRGRKGGRADKGRHSAKKRGADTSVDDSGQERGGGRGEKRGSEQHDDRDTGKETSESVCSAEDSQGTSRKAGTLTSITVTESQRTDGKGAQDKVLVVEKGPSTQAAPAHRVARVGSIEVVTASQFALLEKTVKQLETVAGPLPLPSLPDNERLRQDLAKGTASLSDTMQAMQLNARVQAAEQGLTCMAGLLTQLAAAGALPKNMVGRIGEIRAELQEAVANAASYGGTAGATSTASSLPDSKKRGMGGPGAMDASAGPEFVTDPQMVHAVGVLKVELLKEITEQTTRASQNAEAASTLANSVVDKVDVGLKMDERITKLFSQTTDYAAQLSGFDSGLTTQLASFQEQMTQMRKELKEGLTCLEQANNNAETAAIIDLTERYEALVLGLENTSHNHRSLVTYQKQLGEELRSLVECVEMLREQKADRDEVLDALRDKASMSRLAGLLHEDDFKRGQEELGKRIEHCHEKFNKQDEMWLNALNDLAALTGTKAEIIHLLALRDTFTDKLKNVQVKLRHLYYMLGEPKAALLMRKLAKGAVCGSCLVPALMETTDIDYGKPPPLPELRPPPLGEEGPCQTLFKPMPSHMFDSREHVCRRWVGGSHTLISEHVVSERASGPLENTVPTRRYSGYGTDGQRYLFEEEKQPCVQCNKQDDAEVATPLPTPTSGGGDQPRAQATTSKAQGTTDDKKDLK